MQLEVVKVSDLHPLTENVRRHNDKQIDELIRSVKQFGQTRAIVIDESDTILIGNGLFYALQKMGAEEVFAFRKTGLTEIQKKKLVLSDNRIYSLGADDYDGVNSFINQITNAGDFDIAGFDTYTLEMMTMDDQEAEEDMRGYGTVTNETMRNAEGPVSQTQNSYQPPHNAEIPAFTGQGNQLNTHAVETPVSHPEAVRRSVVCPNCGEVIYID